MALAHRWQPMELKKPMLVSPETQEELECRIVYLGDPGERGSRGGVEFLTPAPHFWGIDFDARQATN